MATIKWSLDPTHSELGFKVKHLMISNVSGSFKDFKASMETKGTDFSTANIQLRADVASIHTGNEQRDVHLRTSDFFEVENYPELLFQSTSIDSINEDHFVLNGNLSLKGVTKPVQLNVEFSGVTKDPWGGERAGFTVTGKINRKDWGVNFNAVLETGGVALGEEVKLIAEIQMVKEVVAVAEAV